MRCRSRDEHHLSSLLPISAVGLRRGQESSHRTCNPEERFTLLAKTGIGRLGRTACLGIEQDGADDILHVPHNTGRNVINVLLAVKGAHHAFEVVRLRVAGHEPLDKLTADIRSSSPVAHDGV